MLKVKESSIDYFKLEENRITLGKDFKLIPKDIFFEVLNLFCYYAEQKLEVLVYINYQQNTKNYVITVPTQRVSIYDIKVDRTSKDYKEVNLLTGELEKNLVRLGSIHSHHILSTKFSSDDDLNDFSNPPGLHILVGDYPFLELVCSVVINSTRYYIEPKDILEDLEKYTEELKTAKFTVDVRKFNNQILTLSS